MPWPKDYDRVVEEILRDGPGKSRKVGSACAALARSLSRDGLLSPEIAFEVSLPGKWNGRFYMIGSIGY